MVSTVAVASATARILLSTYSASLRMYSASEPRRLYAWSKISTRTLLFLASRTGCSLGIVAIRSTPAGFQDTPSPRPLLRRPGHRSGAASSLLGCALLPAPAAARSFPFSGSRLLLPALQFARANVARRVLRLLARPVPPCIALSCDKPSLQVRENRRQEPAQIPLLPLSQT